MDATIKETPITYKVYRWDGKPFDADAGEGYPYVARIADKDERARGILNFHEAAPATLMVGDALVEHYTDGELSGIAVMDWDQAAATFHLERESTTDISPLELTEFTETRPEDDR